MVYVYVIQSQPTGRRYVGITKDISTRLKAHNTGRTRSTKPYRPWALIHWEEFESHQAARVREKYLKSSAGRRYLQKILEEE